MEQTGLTVRGRVASVVRIVCLGTLMAVLVAAELYLHNKTIPVFLDYLREAEHKNSAWIGKQLSYMLPFLTVAVFQYAVYCRAERASSLPGVPFPSNRLYQREKMWEILLLTVLVYGVMLPYCVHLSDAQYAAALEEALISGTTLPQTDGKVDDKLMYHLAEWFIRLAIPLGLLAVYHASRAGENTDRTEAPDEEATA